MTPKNWYKSRTIWINVAIVVGGIGLAIGDYLSTTSVISAMGLINVLLRAITSQPLK